MPVEEARTHSLLRGEAPWAAALESAVVECAWSKVEAAGMPRTLRCGGCAVPATSGGWAGRMGVEKRARGRRMRTTGLPG